MKYPIGIQNFENLRRDGRMDILMQTPQYIYILELKLDKSADEALAQIEEKGYAKPFVNDNRQLFKIGINFSTSLRRIDEWKIDNERRKEFA